MSKGEAAPHPGDATPRPGGRQGDPDASTTVGDALGEVIDGGHLVDAGHAHGVVGAVHLDVLLATLLELLDGGLDVLRVAELAHFLGQAIGVEADAVPVARKGFWVVGDLGVKLLGDAVQEETSEPEVITHCDPSPSTSRSGDEGSSSLQRTLDAFAESDLEHPLAGHHLGLDAGNVDASVEAGFLVDLDDIPTEDLAGAEIHSGRSSTFFGDAFRVYAVSPSASTVSACPMAGEG